MSRDHYRRQAKITAIHEAGHCVMHYLERIPFNYVSICPDSSLNADGVVHPRASSLKVWNHQRPKQIRIYMAGKVAEEFYTGEPVIHGCEHDLHLATCLAKELSSDHARLLDAAYLDVRERLSDPSTWPAVELLAAELLERRTMKVQQVYTLIRCALGRSSQGRPATLSVKPTDAGDSLFFVTLRHRDGTTAQNRVAYRQLTRKQRRMLAEAEAREEAELRDLLNKEAEHRTATDCDKLVEIVRRTLADRGYRLQNQGRDWDSNVPVFPSEAYV